MHFNRTGFTSTVRQVVLIWLVAGLFLTACVPAQALASNAREASFASLSPTSNTTSEPDQNSETLRCYEIFEIKVEYTGVIQNPYTDVFLDVVFTAPNGAKRTVPGFYDQGSTWKARFRPDLAGNWSYTSTLSAAGEILKTGSGSFKCTKTNADGRVRQNPKNAYQWVFESGKPYFPLGIQDCFMLDSSGRLAGLQIDGEKRNDGKARKVTVD